MSYLGQLTSWDPPILSTNFCVQKLSSATFEDFAAIRILLRMKYKVDASVPDMTEREKERERERHNGKMHYLSCTM